MQNNNNQEHDYQYQEDQEKEEDCYERDWESDMQDDIYFLYKEISSSILFPYNWKYSSFYLFILNMVDDENYTPKLRNKQGFIEWKKDITYEALNNTCFKIYNTMGLYHRKKEIIYHAIMAYIYNMSISCL